MGNLPSPEDALKLELLDGDGNVRPPLPTMNKQNFSAIKALLAEMIERDKRGTFGT